MTKKMELALRVPGLLLICSLFTCQMNMICAQGVTLYPSSLSVHTDTFRLLLIPDQNTTASFNCSIQQVVTQAETTNSNLCFSGNQNTTSGWQLPSLVFSVPESSFSTMDVTLSTFPLTRLQETLVVWCCDSSNTLNINAAAIITVDVQPNIVVNANFSAPAKATIFPNPAYQNIAPCSCDLLQGACDVNCCCDSDCTPEDFSTFECLSGAFGGNFTVDDANLCGTQRFDVPDWHLFTCVERLNSPDLGLFYANTTGRQYAVSDTQFSAVASQTTVSTFSFAGTPGVSSVQPPTQVTGYRNGDPVLIQLMLNGALTNGYLTLPQASLTGQCLRSSLVAFQNSSSSFCEVSVSAATNCLAGSLLDVNYYVTNTTLVLRAPSGGNAAVNVSYFRGQAADYVKTNSGQGTSTANSFFTPSTTASIDQPIAKPPTPTISGSNCSNAVASVTYVMTWESNLVTNLDVRVVVADVPLTGAVETPGIPPNNLLTQSFAVESQYFTQRGVKRSGNPGYDVGLPVISGIGDINVPTNPVDLTQQLKIWQPGASGLCADSGTAAPPYGQDTTSGCLLRVSLSEFRNCSGLRAAVEANQRALVAGVNLVSRYGSPNRTTFVADEWISVVGSLAVANASNDTILGQCDNIPSQMHIEFVTSLSGRIGGFPVTEIVGARISWTRETWKLQCSGGACQDDVTTESFAVYSTASFTSVPGSASTSDCSTDATCWAELLLPLTKVFYIDQSYTVAEREFEYNLVWALTVIYFSLGAALLTLNWNKIGKTVRSIFPV